MTGIRYVEATAIMRQLSGERSIKGVSEDLMRRTFAMLGRTMRTVEFDPSGARTFARWLADRNPEQRQATFILILGRSNRHYVVVRGRKGGDSFSRGPVWLSDMNWRRRPVTRVFEVREVDASAQQRAIARITNDEATKQRLQSKASRLRRKYREQAEVHAARLGVKLRPQCSYDIDDIIYDLPDGKTHGGSHLLWYYDWEEAALHMARIVPDEFEDDEDYAEAA